jgi:hypothetical protein
MTQMFDWDGVLAPVARWLSVACGAELRGVGAA